VLLEQQAATCIGLIGGGGVHHRVKRFLRLLALDLMIDAEKQRRSYGKAGTISG